MSAPSAQMIRVRERLDSLGMSATVLAKIVGVTPSAMNQAMRGVINLDGENEAEAAEVSLLLVVLAGAMAPVRLPITEPDALRTIIDFVRTHDISADKVRKNISEIFGAARGAEPNVVEAA